jgi:hypothetical protein
VKAPRQVRGAFVFGRFMTLPDWGTIVAVARSVMAIREAEQGSGL